VKSTEPNVEISLLVCSAMDCPCGPQGNDISSLRLLVIRVWRFVPLSLPRRRLFG
jgi:hypothetical protein